MIRGIASDVDDGLIQKGKRARPKRLTSLLRAANPPKVVVTVDHDLVVVGINARDRPGLLLDVSKGLLQLSLQLHSLIEASL